MTAIVGIECDGRVLLGADSAVSWGETIIACRNPKVWSVGKVVLGVAGDARSSDVVRYHMTDLPPYDGISPVAWAARDLAEAFREAIKAAGAKDSECDMIVGVGGRLLCIDSDGGVISYPDGYGAIGSGGPVALGALYATRDSRHRSPRDRIVAALEAAALYCPSVRGPWVFAPDEML